jgi:F0F1-type ATP synthase membrane subunit b/b'
MSSKLTLSIDQEIIERAKQYAKTQGRSLSNIIEEYLKSISKDASKNKEQELSKIVKELKGSIKVSKDMKSYDTILEDALIKKYVD